MLHSDVPPYIGIDGHYYSVKLLKEVLEELKRAAIVVAAGLEAPTKSDRLLWAILSEHAHKLKES